MKRVALLAEFTPTFPSHVATTEALKHSSTALGAEVAATWLPTAEIPDTLFDDFDGIWIAPGSPYKSMERTLAAIRYAREQEVPCFGTCGGFQHMLLEYARNVLGFQNAQHAEYDPYASNLFISQLACSLVGRRVALRFVPGSRVAAIYGTEGAEEEYYCNFGVNPDKVPLLRRGTLQISGSDAEGEVRVLELCGHPFFLGTLFVPQLRSTPAKPHPLVTAFVQAVVASRRQSGSRWANSMSFERQPVLRGELLELRPLRADDFDALFRVAADPLIWEQHPDRDRYQEATFRAFFAEALASGGALVALDRATGQIIGSSRYHDYDTERSVVEIGWSFLARAYWGGRYNGEMKQLMLEHAFKIMKRVIFIIGADNRRSQRAVEKIGAVRAGTTLDAQGQERMVYELTPALYARGQRSGTT